MIAANACAWLNRGMPSRLFVRRAIVTTLVSAALSIFPAEAQTTNKVFRAGAATANITPWIGVQINGNFTWHSGTNVHDELHARCVVMDDGEHRLAIVVADSCMIYRETFDAAKQIVQKRSGLAPENILMSATHTHSAPASVSIFQAQADTNYQHFLSLRLADSVLRAIANMKPAKVGWGVGSEPKHVSNRRWKMQPGVKNINVFGKEDAVRMNPSPGSPELLEPAGPTDPQLPVLAVQSLDGKPIALLANYSLHYVGGTGGGIVSADYYGAFCSRVAQLLDAEHQEIPFVPMMSNGTSGDCNNMNFREVAKPQPNYEQINRVADDIAKNVVATYQKIQWHDWVPLKSAQTELTLGVRLPSAEEVAKAKTELEKAERINGQLRNRDDVYRRETVLMADFPKAVPLLLQAHRIGELGIVAIPCEVFVEIGLDIKKRSPLKPTFTIELANGYNGYLPTPEHHKLGGYETWRARSSYLEVEAAPKISAALFDLLSRVK